MPSAIIEQAHQYLDIVFAIGVGMVILGGHILIDRGRIPRDDPGGWLVFAGAFIAIGALAALVF